MIALLIRRTDDDLLQERQRSVDVVCLAHRDALSTCLLSALITSQINQVKLAGDDLLRLLDRRPRLDMNSEDGVRARRVHVEVVICGSSALLALEQAVQGFFLVTAFLGGEATNGDFPIHVILHRDGRACLVLWLRL